MSMTLVLMALALLSQESRTLPATLEGVVAVRDASNVSSPLPEATVKLSREGGNSPMTYFAESADDGHFKFTNVPPGRYRLLARREGYVSGEYGQEHLHTPGVVIDVASNARLSKMDLTLTLTGSISGRIVNRDGKPVGLAKVELLRPSYQEGERVLTVVQSTVADDLGNYRLFWLPPGRYYVSATVPNGPIDPTLTLDADATNSSLFTRREIRQTPLTKPVLIGGTNQIYARIYYPGSADQRNAQPIDITPASEIREMNFAAGFIPSYRVRGVIVDSETGQVVKNAQVRATSGNESGIVPLDSATGAFSIGHVPAGDIYVLTAVAGQKSGRMVLEFHDHDFEVRVPIYPSFPVSGRVTVDGHPAEAADLAGLRFNVQGTPTGIGGLQPSGAFTANGTFTFNVSPGDYLLNISPILNRTGRLIANIPLGNIAGREAPASTAFNVPANLKSVYVKSIQLGDKDVLNGGLHLDGPPSEMVEIEISTRGASLQGIVQDAKGQPSVNVVTVLVPDAPLRQRPDLYKVTRTNSAGRFTLNGIPAGAYRVFAWEDILDGSWRDPDVIREYEARGKTITVDDGASIATTITVID